MPARFRRTRPSRVIGDPLRGVNRLVVDVNNLLGALPRARSEVAPAALPGRLRAVVPAGCTVELVFDGPPPRGAGRPGPGLIARYGGSRSADDVIVSLVEAGGRPQPGVDPAILVVTDDGELRRAVRDLGAATAGTAWLIDLVERTRFGAPSVGQARTHAAAEQPADEDRRGWRPGRRATVKRGNPRRTGRDRRAPGTP